MAAREPKVLPFTVEGSGEFPTDMLRYDVCEFASPEDEAVAGKGYDDPAFEPRRRRVQVLSSSLNLHSKPTRGRWASFGWHVVSVEAPQALSLFRDLQRIKKG
jgi:hypothetical protein